MSGDRTRKTLIIGYGSPIRGDDAVGPLVADRLQREGVPESVEVIARHILTADLVPDIAAADQVIFLDAAADGETGEVRCHRLVPDRSAVSTMAHFLDPRELLAWCEVLYDRLPESHLITVGSGRFDFASYELSPAAAAAAETMARKVRDLLDAR